MAREITPMKILHNYNQLCKNFSDTKEYIYYNGYFHSKNGAVLHYIKLKENELKDYFSHNTVYILNGSEIYNLCDKISKPNNILIHKDGEKIYFIPEAINMDEESNSFKVLKKDLTPLNYAPFPNLAISNEFIEYNDEEMIDITGDVSQMLSEKLSKQILPVGEIVLIWTKSMIISFKSSERVFIKYRHIEDDIYEITIKHRKSVGDLYYRFKIINIDMEHQDK